MIPGVTCGMNLVRIFIICCIRKCVCKSKKHHPFSETLEISVDDTCVSIEKDRQENGNIYAKKICDIWGYKDNGLSTEWFVIPQDKVMSVVSNDLSKESVEVK